MALIWGVLTTGFWKTTCAVLTTAAKVARMPAKHCMQTHLDRHKDHTNYLFTVTMPPALTHEQCRHRICALCFVNMAEKQIGQFPKKKRNSWRTSFLNTAWTIPRCQPAFANGDDFASLKYHSCHICPQISVFRCIFDLNAQNDNKRIDRGEWAGQRVEIHPLLPASYTCGDYRPSTRASLDFKCVCRICKFARVSGGEAMKEKAKRKRNGRKTTTTTIKKICPTCYSGEKEGMQHKCSSNDVEKAENLLNQLPESVAAKLASAYIKSHTPSTPTEPILLPQPSQQSSACHPHHAPFQGSSTPPRDFANFNTRRGFPDEGRDRSFWSPNGGHLGKSAHQIWAFSRIATKAMRGLLPDPNFK